MNILHLAGFLRGDAGRMVTELATSQQRAGHDVIVVASHLGAGEAGHEPAWLDRLEDARVPVRLVHSTSLRDSGAHARAIDALDNLYRPGAEPDAIHTHAPVASLIALIFRGARRRSMAIVQTAHEWLDGGGTPEDLATDVHLMNFVDRVVAPSHEALRHLALRGVPPSQASVIAWQPGDLAAEQAYLTLYRAQAHVAAAEFTRRPPVEPAA